MGRLHDWHLRRLYNPPKRQLLWDHPTLAQHAGSSTTSRTFASCDMLAQLRGRKHNPTVQEVQKQRPQTEQIDVVLPSFGNTVTVTEVGDVLAGLDAENHRASLVMVSGPTPGQVFSLSATAVIGRDPMADIVIEDGAVSRRHVRITMTDNRYIVEDLGSANGTFVGGARLSMRELHSGDRLQLGPRVVLRFALFDDAEEAMHRRLFESSTRDALTSAYNKKYITERLVAEVAYASRHRSPLEVVVFDLDRFKQVNDVHGHLVGDQVLRVVADCVHGVIRSEDVFGRFGGEEFVVISRGANAARLAERIRAAVEQLTITTDRGAIRATLSLGVARFDELDSPVSADALLEKADLRLLVAKRSGRNQVCSTD